MQNSDLTMRLFLECTYMRGYGDRLVEMCSIPSWSLFCGSVVNKYKTTTLFVNATAILCTCSCNPVPNGAYNANVEPRRSPYDQLIQPNSADVIVPREQTGG
jgi:hypothetical protein